MINFWVALVAALHIAFLILESFLWTRPFGLKVFRQSEAQAQATKVLAANQGLYNGFLAAGLSWSLMIEPGIMAHQLQVFFLVCVAVAGVVGAWTANKMILFIQTLPAAVPLLLLLTKNG